MASPAGETRRLTFPREMRLGGKGAFEVVYATRRRVAIGPLRIHARRNELNYPRLGLSIARAVGTAAARNTIKRRLREAFRIMQHDWKHGYDVVVSARSHAPLTLEEYQKALHEAMKKFERMFSEKPTKL